MELQSQVNQNAAVELPAECLELLILTDHSNTYFQKHTMSKKIKNNKKKKIQLVFPSNFLMQNQLHPSAEGPQLQI